MVNGLEQGVNAPAHPSIGPRRLNIFSPSEPVSRRLKTRCWSIIFLFIAWMGPRFSRDFGRRSRRDRYRSTCMNWLILAETTAKKVNVSRRRWALFPVVLGVHGPEILIIFRPAEIRVVHSTKRGHWSSGLTVVVGLRRSPALASREMFREDDDRRPVLSDRSKDGDG